MTFDPISILSLSISISLCLIFSPSASLSLSLCLSLSFSLSLSLSLSRSVSGFEEGLYNSEKSSRTYQNRTVRTWVRSPSVHRGTYYGLSGTPTHQYYIHKYCGMSDVLASFTTHFFLEHFILPYSCDYF